MTIEEIWRNRVGALGLFFFSGFTLMIWLAPHTLLLVRMLMLLFGASGIFLYVQFLRQEPWTRLFLILLNGLSLLWSFGVLATGLPAIREAGFSAPAMGNMLGSMTFTIWMMIVEVQFLLVLGQSKQERDPVTLTGWMQSKIFITALVTASALLLASLNHIAIALHAGFFSAAPGQYTMEVSLTRIALFGFWGWGAWHVGLCGISLLLLGSILSFLWLARGARLIPLSCLLLAGWMGLSGILSLGTLVADARLRHLWPLALTMMLFFTTLGTVLSYWLYDAFRYAFAPEAYLAARRGRYETGLL